MPKSTPISNFSKFQTLTLSFALFLLMGFNTLTAQLNHKITISGKKTSINDTTLGLSGSIKLFSASGELIDAEMSNFTGLFQFEYSIDLQNPASLGQNYPNPFSGATIFKTPRDKTTILRIYNSLGQQVKKYQHEPGNIFIQVDLSDLPSGMYFAVLKSAAGKSLGVQKIVQLKGKMSQPQPPQPEVIETNFYIESESPNYFPADRTYLNGVNQNLSDILIKHVPFPKAEIGSYEIVDDSLKITVDGAGYGVAEMKICLFRESFIPFEIQKQVRLPVAAEISAPLNDIPSGMYRMDFVIDQTVNGTTASDTSTLSAVVIDKSKAVTIETIWPDSAYADGITVTAYDSSDNVISEKMTGLDGKAVFDLEKGQYRFEYRSDKSRSADNNLNVTANITYTKSLKEIIDKKGNFSVKEGQTVVIPADSIVYAPTGLDSIVISSAGSGVDFSVQGKNIVAGVDDKVYDGQLSPEIQTVNAEFIYTAAHATKDTVEYSIGILDTERDVKIVVRDANGEPMPDVVVTVYDSARANELYSQKTDSSGSVIPELLRGNYVVSLSADNITNLDNLRVGVSQDTTLNQIVERHLSNSVPSRFDFKEGVPVELPNPIAYFQGEDPDTAYYVLPTTIEFDGNTATAGKTAAGSYGVQVVAVKGNIVYPVSSVADVERMTNFSGRIIDVSGDKLGGGLIIGDKQFLSDGSGLVDVAVSPADSGRFYAYSVRDDSVNSFVTHHRKIPLTDDYDMVVNFPVTNFDGISDNVPVGQVITPEVYRDDLVGQGVTNAVNGAWYRGWKAFDNHNKRMKIFIARGQLEEAYPNSYSSYTPEQQAMVAQQLEELLLPLFNQEAHKPEIIIATDKDTLPHKIVNGFKRPDEGCIWVMPSKKSPLFGYRAYDYDKDGTLDAGKMVVTFPEQTGMANQEYKSYFAPGPVVAHSMDGKTVFSEHDLYWNPEDPYEPSPSDKKLIDTVQRIFSEGPLRVIDGELYIGIKPKASNDDILSLLPPPGFKMENGLYVPR